MMVAFIGFFGTGIEVMLLFYASHLCDYKREICCVLTG